MTRKEEAEKMISKFQDKFFKEFNINLIVMMKSPGKVHPKVKLESVEAIVNELLKSESSDPNGIKSKSRLRIIVNLRQCFYKIVVDMGYTLAYAGKYLGFDHATVLHSCKQVRNLLSNNDPLTTINYNRIINELEKRPEFNAHLQFDECAKSNP